MNIAELKKMSAAERLQIMEDIWDSFLYEKTEMESPPWHEEIIEERKRKIAEGKARFISPADLKAGRTPCGLFARA